MYPENGCSIRDSKIKYLPLKSLLIGFMIQFFFHPYYFYFDTVIELNTKKTNKPVNPYQQTPTECSTWFCRSHATEFRIQTKLRVLF